MAGIPVTAPLIVPSAGSGASGPSIAPANPPPGSTTGAAPATGGARILSPTGNGADLPLATRPTPPITIGQQVPLAAPGLGLAAPKQRVPLDRTPASTERPNGIPVPAPVGPTQPTPPVPAEAAPSAPTPPSPPARSGPSEALFPGAVTDPERGSLAGTRPIGKAERVRTRATSRQSVSPPAPPAAQVADEPSDRGRPMGKAERSRIRAAAQTDHDEDEKRHADDAEHVDRQRDKDTTADRNGRDDRTDDKGKDDKNADDNGKDVQGDDVQGDDVQGDDVQGDDVQGDDVQGDDVQGDDVQGKRKNTDDKNTDDKTDKDGDRTGDGDDRAAGHTHDAARDTRSDLQNVADNSLTEPDPGENADHDQPGDRSDGFPTTTAPRANQSTDQPTSQESDPADRDTRPGAGDTDHGAPKPRATGPAAD